MPIRFTAALMAAVTAVLCTLLPALAAAQAPAPAAAAPAGETVAATTERSTPAGHMFMAPQGFVLRAADGLILLQAPEGDGGVALIEVQAGNADDALARAWAAYANNAAARSIRTSDLLAPANGWTERRSVIYETSPAEQRVVQARALRADAGWVVAVLDSSRATFERRVGPLHQILESLRAKDTVRERLVKAPRRLDEKAVLAFERFVQTGMDRLDIPGVAYALIDRGRVVAQGGYGVRTQGRRERVDEHTLFMAGALARPMTSLLMAQAVDARLLRWDDPLATAFPGLQLPDAELARQLQARHLVCACVGLPPQTLLWSLQHARVKPDTVFETLAATAPTARPGEVFVLDAVLTSAAGYSIGARMQPGTDRAAAFEESIRRRVFTPLGMSNTTFDFKRAQAAVPAGPHGDDLFDERTKSFRNLFNQSAAATQPANGLWTSANDLARFVLLELSRGLAPDSLRLVTEAQLRAREAPMVQLGDERHYGLGLVVDRAHGIDIVSHSGHLLGYHARALWLPQHGLGLVLLTNADAGRELLAPAERKLLELAFDAQPQADLQLARNAENRMANLRRERQRLALPPEAAASARLAPRYVSAELGALDIRRAGREVYADFGSWSSRMGSRRNADGSLSLVTVDLAVRGQDFTLEQRDGKRALVLRDGLREFVFTETAPVAR
jgi:CubicO group peptidase (beta-lactamase class C family)